ncbi:MAG: hypothetical protein KatS3mg129_3301 [Leptospiraceae bacterium]|nr:MAG: hypothetical protein KatS3mg129_3301 [Leptospiraceae bacterium]
MKNQNKRKFITYLLLSWFLLSFTNCGYNEIQRKDEAVNAAWAEVLNQYKRRADLIPQLVKVVQAYAIQEKEVLIKVTEARSKVGSIQATPELLNNPEAFQKFQEAQGELSSALQRLMVVVERYPELKSDRNFRDLQAQIEGTENRIAVARRRYIQAVQEYNTTIRIFPNVITAKIFGYTPKPQFQIENQQQLEKPPEIDFNNN